MVGAGHIPARVPCHPSSFCQYMSADGKRIHNFRRQIGRLSSIANRLLFGHLALCRGSVKACALASPAMFDYYIGMKRALTMTLLQKEAKAFAEIESKYPEPSIFGTTDGKAIGTYLEHKFKAHVAKFYKFVEGNSAKGIDFPELGIDVKVTSIQQPQSSSPFKSARQKIFGLGYNLLIFVYDKKDDLKTSTAILNMKHVVFVKKERTADFQMTSGLRKIVENQGNADDIVAFMQDKFLPVDEIEARKIAEDVMKAPPEVGYLTISNALQWRLQYARVIEKAGAVKGVVRVR
jgi:hypothetical protein